MKKYIMLISKFISREIKTSEFEKDYLEMFKSESTLDKEIFEVLNKLFIDIDSYCGDPEIANYNKDDPFHDIDEKELLNRAEISLQKLLEIDKANS